MTFKEYQLKIAEFLKGLIKEDSSSEFIAQVGDTNKALEELGRDHEATLKEMQVAKDKLVEFVTNTSTINKPEEPTGEAKSIDEVLINELDKIKD